MVGRVVGALDTPDMADSTLALVWMMMYTEVVEYDSLMHLVVHSTTHPDKVFPLSGHPNW